MKKFLFLIFFLFPLLALALPETDSKTLPQGEVISGPPTADGCVPEKSKDQETARSGCCSWHGGVCGCDQANDRIICCDHTFSPTCTCSGY